MTADDALRRLGSSTAQAAAGLLEMFAPGQIQVSGVSVVPGDANPLDGLPGACVATSVSYTEGVTGGNVFILTLDGARRLAAAMMGMDAPEDPEATELSELELSAVAEAANQMMASAAGATSAVLETGVEIGPPETKTFATTDEAADVYPKLPHAIRVAFSVCGEPCRLVQFVPNAFVVRMTRALDEMVTVIPESSGVARVAGGGGEAGAAAAARGPSLSGIPVRVWAELGRAEMPSAEFVDLPAGAVVELDRQADDAIDLYVNGTRFATGRLMVVDETDWAVRIETVLDATHEAQMEAARWPESW
jgi:flagellar motor switch protein FliN/FliY